MGRARRHGPWRARDRPGLLGERHAPEADHAIGVRLETLDLLGQNERPWLVINIQGIVVRSQVFMVLIVVGSMLALSPNRVSSGHMYVQPEPTSTNLYS